MAGGPVVESDPPPPEDGTDLTLVGVDLTSLEVSWTPSANSLGLLSGYRVYVNDAMIATLPTTATGYVYENLTPASAYALKASAFDLNNKESIGQKLAGYTRQENVPRKL